MCKHQRPLRSHSLRTTAIMIASSDRIQSTRSTLSSSLVGRFRGPSLTRLTLCRIRTWILVLQSLLPSMVHIIFTKLLLYLCFWVSSFRRSCTVIAFFRRSHAVPPAPCHAALYISLFFFSVSDSRLHI